MKIATNKLSDLYAFYKSKLILIYDEDELYAIFELVCEHYLGYTKADTTLNFESNLNQSDVLKIYDTAKALKKGTPIQYVLGEAYFYDLKFKVTSATLIPRPETEELVDIVIKQLRTTHNTSSISILDIGTGSGCIPITLKKHLPEAILTGIDISHEALKIAQQNAIKNNVEVEFLNGDILSNISPLNSRFSVMISNPPYVLKSEAKQIENRVLQHEPHLALFVEDHDPIIFYKRIIDLCQDHLAAKGYLFFELNPLYAQEVKSYANDSKMFTFMDVLDDMSGKQRFLIAQKK